MSPADSRLALVEPQFRDRVATRIDAIEEFLAKPGRKNAIRIGRAIGLSPNGFYKLVRAWRANRDPGELVGRGRRPNLATVDHKARHGIIRDVIAERGSSDLNLAQEVIRRADLSGVPMLSEQWIYDAARSIRRDTVMVGIEADILLDIVVLDYPVHYEERPVRPHMIAAIDPTTLDLIGAALCIHAPSASDWARALLNGMSSEDRGRVVRSGGTLETLRLSIPDKPVDTISGFLAAMSESCLLTSTRDSGSRAFDAGNRTLGRIAGNVLGHTFLQRKVRTQLSLLPIEKRLAAPYMGVPVTLNEAEDYILKHIHARNPSNPLASLSSSATAELRDRLRTLADTYQTIFPAEKTKATAG